MDTKLKKISYPVWTKITAFAVAVACGVMLWSLTLDFSAGGSSPESAFSKSYFETNDYYGEMINAAQLALSALQLARGDYGDADGLSAEWESAARDFRYEAERDVIEKYEDYYQSIYGTSLFPRTAYQGGDEDTIIQERIRADKAEEINRREIQLRQEHYQTIQNGVNQGLQGFYYYASDGQTTVTNAENPSQAFFTSRQTYYILENGQVGADSNLWPLMRSAFYVPNSHNIAFPTLYVSMKDAYLAGKAAAYQTERDAATQYVVRCAGLGLLFLLCLAYLILSAGRTGWKSGVRLNFLDRIYSDVNVILLILSLCLCMVGIDFRTVFYRIVNSTCTALALALALLLLLSLVRRFKDHTLLRHSLIWAIAARIGRILNDLLHNRLFVLLPGREFRTFADGVRRIQQGEPGFQIEIQKDRHLQALAGDINSISSGLQASVDRQLRAERMKTELITNVSHDLKTPLTSIINYAGLLAKEHLQPDFANDYVKIISQKSEKLKDLTNDLFEISKAQSGNIDIHPERLELGELLQQSMAELSDRIAASSLDFRVSCPAGGCHIMADGRKLSRVVENLLGNILKYAMENSRVYIDIKQQDGKCVMEFKNISSYEMNFDAEEIMERFTRGDQSRTTQGNGLGLAIAKSYVEACGGQFRIVVDGDLFKAVLLFDLEK